MNKKEALTKLILALAEYYKNSLSNIKLEINVENLIDYELDSIKKAAKKLIKTEKFMPKVADFVRVIKEVEGRQAEIAWLEIEREIERIGSYGNPVFKDITIYAVVQAMGGWEVFCNIPIDRINFYMKEFVHLYNIYKDKPEVIKNALPFNVEADREALASIIQKTNSLTSGG